MSLDDEAQKTSFWHGITNPKWLSIKVHYFIVYYGIGSYFPFLMLFYLSLGLTTRQISIIEFMNIFVSTVAWPIVGSIADKSGRHSLVLAMFMIAFLIPVTSLAFISPPTQEQYPATLFINEVGNVKLEICGSNVTEERIHNMDSIFIGSSSDPTINQLNCKGSPIANLTTVVNNTSEVISGNCSQYLLPIFFNQTSRFNETKPAECVVEFAVMATTEIFVLICVIRAIGAVSLEPSLSVTDAIAYDMLGPINRGLWGQQRMFAAVGYGVGAAIMGIVLDHFHSFRISFFTMGVFGSATILIALLWLPRRLAPLHKDNEPKLLFCTAIGRALISPVFCIICFIAVASGMLLSVSQIVWPQHLEALGAPKTFFGLCAGVVCIVEIPSFFFAGAVANKLGETVCALIMFLAYSLRYGANAFLTSSTFWIALPVESLHVFCFALFFSAITKIAAMIAPSGTSSTVQSILAAAFGGVGFGCGVLLGSLIYDTYGGQRAFLIFAAFAFSCFLILLILYLIYLREEMVKVADRKVKERQTRKVATIDPLIPNNNEDEWCESI